MGQNEKGAGRKPIPIKKSRTALDLEKNVVHGIKYISLMDEKTQTDIINEALKNYIEQWEQKNGTIQKK